MTQSHSNSDGQGSSSGKLGRFGWHSDPVVDFETEIDKLEERWQRAVSAPVSYGDQPEALEDISSAIERAMSFQVGGREDEVRAKNRLRFLEVATRAVFRERHARDALLAAAFEAAKKACLEQAPAPAGGAFSNTNSMRVIALDCAEAVGKLTPDHAKAAFKKAAASAAAVAYRAGPESGTAESPAVQKIRTYVDYPHTTPDTLLLNSQLVKITAKDLAELLAERDAMEASRNAIAQKFDRADPNPARMARIIMRSIENEQRLYESEARLAGIEQASRALYSRLRAAQHTNSLNSGWHDLTNDLGRALGENQQHRQGEAFATLIVTLKADDGLERSANHRVSRDQWSRIMSIAHEEVLSVPELDGETSDTERPNP